MTREEVKYASKDYVNYILDKQEYHNENYTEDDIRQAFEKGAEWADEHPVDVWHEAKEKPRSKEWILVQFEENEYETLALGESGVNTWFNVWINEYRAIRWAYISDLLLKGMRNKK